MSILQNGRTVGRGGMNRREFLRLGGAGLAGAALLGSGTLAGCGGGLSGSGGGLTVASWDIASDALRNTIPLFKKKRPGTNVSMQSITIDYQQLVPRLQAGSGAPDVFSLAQQDFQNFLTRFPGTGQVGKNFMTKMWADVHGHFPDTVFNAHTGPAAQMWGLDDFEAADFDSASHGFIGGATPNVENQRLPIQISREALPPDVRRWGFEYKDHVLRWQQQAAVRLQPDNLSYRANFLDLDPRYRDKSGLGLPVVRVTYDLQENEHRAAEFMERKSEEILREMGAAKVWRGKRFGGVLSSHDQGGCRMGEDPAASVVDPDLRVHDTPGLYVYGTSVFPTCHGINPTLTMFALCYRAVERLAQRLRRGEG